MCLKFSIKIKCYSSFLADIYEIETHKICVWAIVCAIQTLSLTKWQYISFLFRCVPFFFIFTPKRLLFSYFHHWHVCECLYLCVTFLPVYIWTWILNFKNVRLHALHIFTRNAMLSLLCFLFIVCFKKKKGRNEILKCERTNICGISILCVLKFINK